MKHIDFNFNGRTYALSFTADALFKCYDRFGVEDDLLAASHAMEPTVEGWANCCWLAALMAAEGEYQRRHLGEDPQPFLKAEDLRTGFMAADSIMLRRAVRAALIQGFEREIKDEDEPEDETSEEFVDWAEEILKMREDEDLKKNPLLSFAENILQSLLSSSG